MRVPGRSLSLSSRLVLCAWALCAAANASPSEPPLRLAVARLAQPAPHCEENAPLPAALYAALVDSLGARGTAAVADTTLANGLGRLDGRFPDPRDYGRTRDYLAATGAKRLVYVNGIRVAEDCGLRYEAALWNTDPLARRAGQSDSAATAAEAAGRLADWLARWLYILEPAPTETP